MKRKQRKTRENANKPSWTVYKPGEGVSVPKQVKTSVSQSRSPILDWLMPIGAHKSRLPRRVADRTLPCSFRARSRQLPDPRYKPDSDPRPARQAQSQAVQDQNPLPGGGHYNPERHSNLLKQRIQRSSHVSLPSPDSRQSQPPRPTRPPSRSW